MRRAFRRTEALHERTTGPWFKLAVQATGQSLVLLAASAAPVRIRIGHGGNGTAAGPAPRRSSGPISVHLGACAPQVRLAGPRPQWHGRASGAQRRACGGRTGRDRCAVRARCAAAPPLTPAAQPLLRVVRSPSGKCRVGGGRADSAASTQCLAEAERAGPAVDAVALGRAALAARSPATRSPRHGLSVARRTLQFAHPLRGVIGCTFSVEWCVSRACISVCFCESTCLRRAVRGPCVCTVLWFG